MTTEQKVNLKLAKLLVWIVEFNEIRNELLKERGVRATDMPLPCLMTFLYIAAHGPCYGQDIAKALGMTPGAISRNTDYLLRIRSHRQGEAPEPGLNLITKRTDPWNARRKVLELSSHGELLIDKLLSM